MTKLTSIHIATLDYPDIVYNATTGLWTCCGSNPTTGVHCSIATNETWAGPAPEALATLTSIEQKPATSTNTLLLSSPASSLASTISSITLSTTTTPLALSASTPLSSLSNSTASISTSGASGISMTIYSASVPSNNAAAVSTSSSTSVSTSTSSSSASASTP